MSSRMSFGQRRSNPNQLDKTQSNKWDVVGLSSIITLVGTAIVYMIGWSYISNWYGYFGIDAGQINIPMQQVLIYSMPTLMPFLVILMLALFIRISLRLRKSETIVSMFIAQGFWLTTIMYTSALYFAFHLLILTIEFEKSPYFLNVYEAPIEIVISSAFGALLLLAIAFSYAHYYLKNKWAAKELIQSMQASYQESILPNRSWGWVILGLFVFLQALSTAAQMAFSDARTGHKRAGSNIQRVLIMGPDRLSFFENLETHCDKNVCSYGPFGLVAQSEDSFFLTNWPNFNFEGYGQFLPEPPLYIIPRNDPNGAFYILPLGKDALIPYMSTKETMTPQPAQPATATFTPSRP